MGKKSARIIRMEDLGLEDDGIVTTTSSKGASDSFYSAKQENRKQSAASRSGKKSEAPSVSDSNQQLNEDSESGLYYDDTESGLWSFRAVGMDEKSVPFDEESVLPTITQEGESNSINYSIDDYSEDPLDRYSLADMELAVVAKPQSKVQRPKVKKTRTARGRKVTTNSEPPIPEYVQPSPPIRRSVGSSSQQDEDQCDQRSRVPSKAQKRCTRMLLAAFVAMFLIVIGVGLVIYFFYLKDDPSSISGPSAGGGGDGDDFLDPPPGYDYVTITASPTTPPSSETGPLEEIASPTGQPVVPPTRSPVFAEIAALTNYLATEYSVVFPDDPSAPNNQAVAWLLEEAEEVNTSVMVLSEKLVQRFGLVALTMNLDLDLDLDANSTSLAEPLVDECDWTGVSCTNGTVTELSWGNAQLEGAIPPEIGLLTDLTYLDLSQNQLEGSLPDELFELTELEELFLYDNQLTGTISDRIGDLNNLERLHLSHNELSGSLPLTMRSPIEFIRPYRYINLKSNKLSGVLPTGLRWRELWYLDLGGNGLEGPLPVDIDNMVEIRHMYLDNNRFNGTIPDVLPQIGNGRIETLSLDHNEFEGNFPDQWDIRWHMVSLTLHNNSFTQDLPKDVCDMNVFRGGEMVELNADCNVCSCASPFCQQC